MHRVLPECTCGLIPEVQGALNDHFVSPVPAVLVPCVHLTRKVKFHAASKR